MVSELVTDVSEGTSMKMIPAAQNLGSWDHQFIGTYGPKIVGSSEEGFGGMRGSD